MFTELGLKLKVMETSKSDSAYLGIGFEVSDDGVTWYPGQDGVSNRVDTVNMYGTLNQTKYASVRITNIVPGRYGRIILYPISAATDALDSCYVGDAQACLKY